MNKVKLITRLKYYRACLADSERIDVNSKKISDSVIISCKEKNIATEICLAKADVVRLFNDSEEKKHETIAIILSPIQIYSNFQDNQNIKNVIVHPFWIPAILTKEGKIKPPSNNKLPWLVRGVLSPNDYLNTEYPTLCTCAESDYCTTSFKFNYDDWPNYWESCINYFEKLTKNKPSNLKLPEWTIINDKITIISAYPKGITSSILNTYDHFISLEDDLLPPNLRTILDPELPSLEKIPEITELLACPDHIGQMGNLFPLSPSQRINLLLFEKTSLGQVFAINGPPGTGKTTLLQSICANMIVNNALKINRPPIVLACSTNNQAINNILDSFNSISPTEDQKNGLNERWLPDIQSLGLRLVAKNEAENSKAENKNYPMMTIDRKTENYYQQYIESHPVRACETYFLKKYQSLFPNLQVSTLESIIDDIKQKLQNCKYSIEKYLNAISIIVNISNIWRISHNDLGRMNIELGCLINKLKESQYILEQICIHQLLSRKKPGILKRIIEYFKYGPNKIRQNNLINELSQHTDIITIPEKCGLYQMSEAIYYKLGLIKNNISQGIKHQSDYISSIDLIDQVNKSFLSLIEKSPILKKTLLDDWKKSIWSEKINIFLDLTFRHDAFWYALHYYEGQWLINRNDDTFIELKKGITDSCERYITMSYLFPIFISTFHTISSFFSYSEKNPQDVWINSPLVEFADLLIVDEAGQVSPDVGVSSFGLAKKSLVVGDINQIEPIWSMPSKSLDKSNALRTQLINKTEEYEDFNKTEFGCENGSLMKLAQKSSKYKYPEKYNLRGGLLSEHRRCVREVIEFCNRFVYGNMLQVKTCSIDDIHKHRNEIEGLSDEIRNLPALGYCHINGESFKKVSSRYNEKEADAIAEWVRLNKNELLKAYDMKNDIGKILAIVTPFSAQKKLIYKALSNRGIQKSEITVGTVHALQGAEKNVIIFSPVYGRNDKSSSFFFDQKYNMLNVAISRAKNHFLVFGYMTNFNHENRKLPSCSLGTLLFSQPENEISSHFVYNDSYTKQFEGIDAERISTLDGHRNKLKWAIEISKKRVIIVSPYISSKALADDNIPEMIFEATKRGIEILVYTDAYLDASKGELKRHSQEGREQLKNSGAKLIIKNGIHNKSLVIDDQIIIEGSFNWLSACRDITSPFARYEASHLVKNPQAEDYIKKLLEDLELHE